MWEGMGYFAMAMRTRQRKWQTKVTIEGSHSGAFQLALLQLVIGIKT